MNVSLQPKCTWCRRSDLRTTDDHVFPRCIGGTRQIQVPACDSCQNIISQLEQVLVRQSVFGFYRLGGGPPARHKNKPESGIIEPEYAIVRDSTIGGYAEVCLRVNELPKTLPCIEVDVHGGKGSRIHGHAPEDVMRLVDRLLTLIANAPDETGKICEISPDFVEKDAPFFDDPDFWPRALLDMRGNLKIRSRNPEEALRFMDVVIPLAQQGMFSDFSRWTTGSIPAHTPHHVRVGYDESDVFRVVAKMAYGVLAAAVGSRVSSEDWFPAVRHFIKDGDAQTEKPLVVELGEPAGFKAWAEHHLVLIDTSGNDLRGTVMLYGSYHLVDLGNRPKVMTPEIVVISRRDGSDTRFVDADEASKIAGEIKAYVNGLEASP